MTTNLARYHRIAPLYDFLDQRFERKRYAGLRPLLFSGLRGRLLDAGIGTGRNCAYYPPGGARLPCPTLVASGQLYQMDVTDLQFPAASFDAAVASFLFCVLPDELQLPALRELGRVVKSGGTIRLLEYVRPKRRLRRFITRSWQPWIAWAYGASFDRQTERHVPAAGVELVESRFVAD